MKNVFSITFILLFIVGCKQLDEKITAVYNKGEFYSAIDNSDMIAFRINKNNMSKGVRQDSAFTSKPEYIADKEDEIQEFRNLFKSAKSTGYCCCPNSDLKIEFRNKDKIYDYFFLDATSLADSVIVFQKSYQSSKRITKTSWNEYLTSLTK
ncbi:hypothetical protein IVB69_05065 [Flavobacterium sp. J49]|uniref:hypothetical protein n=1 Tax=Flavobacterium sp. J49 TaxID=2718534 RepID=UPI001594D58B|nr:hypothetical protein [Flavobacterium sp. J49]MBF6640840.1 hypothetical protein [Flavobacterium sp. J49]NIC02087.1 hypothetical protein [Flavobacterium sp. J49]